MRLFSTCAVACFLALATTGTADEPKPASVVGKWALSDELVRKGFARSAYEFQKDGRGSSTVYGAENFVTKTSLWWRQTGDSLEIWFHENPRIIFKLEMSNDGNRLRSYSRDDRTKYSDYIRVKPGQAPGVRVKVDSAPSVVGAWKHKDPDFIGDIVFRKDGTGDDSLGPVESPFTWSQQGNTIAVKYNSYSGKLSTESYVLNSHNELRSTNPGSDQPYVRAK